MKIAHITEAWQGGIATYVAGLIEHQLKAKTDEIHLICAEGKTPNLGSCKQHFYKSSRNPLKFLQIHHNIKKIILEINPDIIHLHSTFPGVYARIMPLRNNNGKKIPIIYCAHGWSFCQEIAAFKKWVYILAERYLCRNTAAIINISRHEYETARKYNIATGQDKIILSCVREKITTRNIPLKLDKKKINIGFIGRLDRQKAHDFLVKQMAASTHKDMAVYIIGDPAKNDATLVKNPDFNYIGWVDGNKIDDYIKLFDAIIIPSRWEGFALTPLEAFRNSKAVIASNRTSLPEVVVHGFNGYVFDFDNPATFHEIITILNKEGLSRMGENARIVYEQAFSGDRHFKEINNVYQFIIKATLGLGSIDIQHGFCSW